MNTGGHVAPGRVVKLRINPTDCISVAAVLEQLGVQTGLISFDQAVRIALSSLLESARQAGAIPKPGAGDDFHAAMQRFRHPPTEYKKVLAVSKFMHSSESAAYVKPLMRESLEFHQMRQEYKEMLVKMQVDAVNVDLDRFNHLQLTLGEVVAAEVNQEVSSGQ